MGTTRPFERCYWVQDGTLLAGCYPGSEDATEADAKLGGLARAGIGTVINLMEPDEVGWNGNPFRPYEDRIAALCKDLGQTVSCLRFPIRDTDIPSQPEMEAILQAIDEGIAQGNSVYIHCWGGKGRTGTVVGCHLIRKGLATPQNFVEVIRQLRGPDAQYGASPENEKQIQFVRDFCTT